MTSNSMTSNSMTPQQIESQSFAIIDQEAGPHEFDQRQWQIVRRMIHTTADFDYLHSVRFHPRAVQAGMAAILGGRPVITDTCMAATGIRKKDLQRFGTEVTCLIDDPQVARTAATRNTTRASVALEAAADRMAGGIYVIGNAPTALLRLIELVRSGQAHPALIIGLPVGFVNAAESKAALLELDLEMDMPYITNVGRKGGSNVAAAVVNALTILALGEQAAG